MVSLPHDRSRHLSRRAHGRPGTVATVGGWISGSKGDGQRWRRHRGVRSGLGEGAGRRGCTVAICGRDRRSSTAAAADVGHGCVPLVCDVSTADGAAGFVEAAIDGARRHRHPRAERRRPTARHVRLDRPSTPIRAASTLNLLAIVAMCKAAVPAMQEQRWGRVVAITSVSVRQPIPNLILSNTARAGATGVPQDAGARGRRRRRHGQLGAARRCTATTSVDGALRQRRRRSLRHGRRRRLRRHRRVPVQRAGASSSPAPRSTSTAAPTRRCCSGSPGAAPLAGSEVRQELSWWRLRGRGG